MVNGKVRFPMTTAPYHIPFEQARDYVAGLKRTGQFRRSYHYIVIADAEGKIIGHLGVAKQHRNWLNEKAREHIALGHRIAGVSGADVEVCGLYR